MSRIALVTGRIVNLGLHRVEPYPSSCKQLSTTREQSLSETKSTDYVILNHETFNSRVVDVRHNERTSTAQVRTELDVAMDYPLFTAE